MYRFIKAFIKYHFADLIKFLLLPAFRRYFLIKTRYSFLPRYKKKVIHLYGNKFIFSDINSFLSAYYAIFVEEIYFFKTDTLEPLIIDCGANIGLSIMFFKYKFPGSKIIAFEADPVIFEILKANLNYASLDNVTIYNKALWAKEDFIPFKQEGADSGRIDFESSDTVFVPTVKLSEILTAQKVDFLKIDIEGAETEVIQESEFLLSNVKYAFVEFHSFHEHKQELDIILKAFQKHNFRYYIKTIATPPNPYLQIYHDDNEIDMALNISFISNK